MCKPDRAIFNLALERVGATAQEAMHVGGSLSSDVAGALGAGLTAVWLNRSGESRDKIQPEPHYEINSLAELPGLLNA